MRPLEPHTIKCVTQATNRVVIHIRSERPQPPEIHAETTTRVAEKYHVEKGTRPQVPAMSK